MAGPASGATLSNGLEKGGMSQEPKGRARQASVGATESTILQSMGLYPSHGDASPSWSRAWCIAILCGILVCGGMAISLLIYVQPSFSNLWLPNSVVIGFLIGTTWRERMLILPIFFCLNVIGNFLMRRPVSFAFATAANNLAEVFFVSFTTTFLASTFSKRPGVAVNLTCVWHVSAFGIGLAWTFVRALCGAYIVQATTTLTNNKTLASLVFQFLDLAPICFTSPFIIAMLYDPPNLLASFRAKPYHGIVFIAVSFLICGAPMSIVPAMPMYAVSPSIIGLYISWPLIGILAAIGGLKGVTFGLLLSGLASTVLIPFRKYHSTACQIPTEDIRRDALFWTQICLLIECLASLIFNVALSQVERARQSIEREVRIRTEELEQAKARAEQADKNKALFLHFLCHEVIVGLLSR